MMSQDNRSVEEKNFENEQPSNEREVEERPWVDNQEMVVLDMEEKVNSSRNYQPFMEGP
jgi:hypothetical protein